MQQYSTQLKSYRNAYNEKQIVVLRSHLLTPPKGKHCYQFLVSRNKLGTNKHIYAFILLYVPVYIEYLHKREHTMQIIWHLAFSCNRISG